MRNEEGTLVISIGPKGVEVDISRLKLEPKRRERPKRPPATPGPTLPGFGAALRGLRRGA